MAGRRPVSDATFRDFVLDQLGGLADLRAQAMFGGHGLYLAETFFAIIHRGRLYLRVDDTTRPVFERRGMKPFRPGPRQTLGGYYEVPLDVLEQPDILERWARAAAGVASRHRRRTRRPR